MQECMLQTDAVDSSDTTQNHCLFEWTKDLPMYLTLDLVFRYERRYIERWLAQGNLRCPATGQRMTRPIALTPNVTLRKSIEEWAEKNAAWMLVSNYLLCMCCCFSVL